MTAGYDHCSEGRPSSQRERGSIMRASSGLMCSVAILAAASCSDVKQLDQVCPGHASEQCVNGGGTDCAHDFQCVTYCLEMGVSPAAPPAAGMGSWCDEIGSYADFCATHVGDDLQAACDAWCATNDCIGGGDGDGDSDTDTDADGDGDGDADADAETDAETDADGDAPECTDAGHCDGGMCHGGVCVECTLDAHCTDLGRPICGGSNICEGCTNPGQCTGKDSSLGACVDGSCYVCDTTTNVGCTSFLLCLNRESCEDCISNADCPAAMSVCNDLNQCEECSVATEVADCAEHGELRACLVGSGCVECTGYQHCTNELGLAREPMKVCDYSDNVCVTACVDCVNDDGCDSLGDDFFCVVAFGASPQCMQEATACERPWVVQTLPRYPPNGSNKSVCTPPPNTSCAGLADLGTECSDDDQCGTRVGGDLEGECLDTDICSYSCWNYGVSRQEPLWCPTGFVCQEGPNVCVPAPG